MASKRSALTRPAGEPTAMALRARADLSFDSAEVLARASWGAGEDQLGKRDEASQPGPMSLTVAADGAIYVLDQVNERVVPFDAQGARGAAIPIRSATAEDLVVTGERLWLLIYEPGPRPGYRVDELARDGTLLQRVRLTREIQLVTGLFATGSASAPDLWVEMEHDAQVLVVAHGVGLPAGAQVTRARGRARADAPRERFVAQLWEGAGFRVKEVFPGNFTSEVLALRTPLAPIAVENWAVTARGVALVITIGAEDDPSEGTWRTFRRLALLPRGEGEAVTVELAAESATDAFRPTAFGPDGSVLQLHLAAEGVALLRWRADDPQAPPDDPAGATQGGAR